MPNWKWIYARAILIPTLGWNALLGRVLKVRRWWDAVDEQLILGARPFYRDAARLAALGVRGIVNTCEEFRGYPDEYQRLGIEQLWIPTIDFTHPSREDVRRAIEFIDRHAAAGDKVYVHCKAGRARSATVALCWLMQSRHLAPEVALQRLLERRPHVNPRLLERPVVQAFAPGGDQSAAG